MKYIDKYNKIKYEQINFRVKKEEKDKLNKVLNNKKVSIRKYVMNHVDLDLKEV